MRYTTYIIITLIFLSCQDQNKNSQNAITTNSISLSRNNSNKIKTIFSAYATAEKGLYYRKEPNINSDILGKLNYGTKVDVVEDINRSFFWIDDL